MSLLICVPIHGQSVHEFDISIQGCLNQFAGFDFDVLYITGDSLVHRARNNGVTSFLASRFDRLLFIDSDIEFKPDSVIKLWNLDESVCCASYPFKMMRQLKDHPKFDEVKEIIPFADKLVYPIPSTVWKDGEMVDIDSLSGPTEVQFAPTGFLMVKRHVFEDMVDNSPELKHMTNCAGGDFKTRRETFSWFDPHVTKEENYKDRITLSEDYSFSETCTKMGVKLILDPSVRLIHHGIFGYGST